MPKSVLLSVFVILSDKIIICLRSLLYLILTEVIIFFTYKILRKISLVNEIVFIIVRIKISAEKRASQVIGNFISQPLFNIGTCGVVDLGAVASIQTAFARGIAASGRPIALALSTAE